MAYIPPHKRPSKDTNPLSPTPFSSQLQRNTRHHNKLSGARIVYTMDSVRRWFIVPFDFSNDNTASQLPPSIRLEEFPWEPMAAARDENPNILVCDLYPHKDVHEATPWVSLILNKVEDDLRASFQIIRSEIGDNMHVQSLPRVVLRFGKILFHRVPSPMYLDNIESISDVETILSGYNRTFSTSVPKPFIEAILAGIFKNIGLDFHKETEYYSVKVFDKTKQEASAITCKCTVVQDVAELELHKVELRDVRHLVVDMSCLGRKLDLRLMLSSKRNMTSLTHEEMDSLRDLIKSAIIDTEAKGGLKWPPRKELENDRYEVIGVWHTKAKLFKNSFLRLKVRHADRFDFTTSAGEVADEVSLRMTELNSKLRDRSFELNPMIDMVRDTLKLIWDHFLCWKGSST